VFRVSGYQQQKKSVRKRAIPVILSIILRCSVLKLGIFSVIVPISCTSVCLPPPEPERGRMLWPAHGTGPPTCWRQSLQREELIYYSGQSSLWKPGRSSSGRPADSLAFVLAGTTKCHRVQSDSELCCGSFRCDLPCVFAPASTRLFQTVTLLKNGDTSVACVC